MDHNICSYGYIIYRKSNKLKDKYKNLSPNELIKLKNELLINKSVDISAKEYINDILTYQHYTPLVAYTGDTSIEGVINNDELLNVPLLIMECTGFSDEDKIKYINSKHIHIDDIIKHNNKFNNDKIILFHFSQQYNNILDIINYIDNINNNLKDKLLFFF